MGWGRGKFSHFTRAELLALAERCEVRWQQPPFAGDGVPGLEDGERATYGAVLDAERTRHLEVLRGLHRELTGDDGPEDLRGLLDGVRINADHGRDTAAIRRALVQALADGKTPDTRDTYARFLHESLLSASRLEAALAEQLGPERASEIVAASGGRQTLTGCDPSTALYRSER